MVAIDELEDAVRKARGVPFTDQVRLDPRKASLLLDRLRTIPGRQPPEFAALLDQLDELLQRAKPVPLTADIRVEREAIYDVVDRMRASIADDRSREL
jgi:hypothetical protein